MEDEEDMNVGACYDWRGDGMLLPLSEEDEDGEDN